MGDRNWRLLGLSVAGVIAIFAVLFVLVDGRRVVETVASAEPALVCLTVGFGLCWLFAWSLMLRTVLGTFGVEVPVGTSFFVYAAAVFANNVTPFGQAGGEPIAALLISRISAARYETGLAGIASVDTLNFVPSISLALLGVGYYAADFTLGERLQFAVGSALALAIGIPAMLVFAWRHRYRLVEKTAGTVTAVVCRLPSVESDPVGVDAEDITARMHRFLGNVERVATDRRRLAVALGLSLLGWLFQGAALLAAFAALGHAVPVYVVLFVVPLGNLAGATPLPGGLGGIEAAFVALLVPTTGVPASTVTAAVLIFRAAIYWMPILIGGSSATMFGVRVYA